MRMLPLVAHLMIVGPVLAQSDTSIAIAAHEVERGWPPRVVQTGDAEVFPFGSAQPVVTCAPLRACVIELEAGERVVATAVGDTERWLAEQTMAAGRTPLVIVKPTACDIATNLVVATDRRVYDVALESPSCTHRATRYTRRIRFYYPGSLVTGASAPPDVFHPESLSFSYHWTPDKRAAWSPVAVYDDGAHVYVRLPDAARHSDLPVLLMEQDDNSTAVLNYVVTNDTYVTDRIFSRAILRDRGRQIELVNMRLFVAK